jgi:hypothetical protein
MSHLEIMLRQLTEDIEALRGVNDQIQDYVTHHGGKVPVNLIKSLSDLDHLVHNMTSDRVD